MKIEISSKEIAKILNTPQNIVDAHIQNMMNEVHGSSKYLEELKKLQKPEKGCYYLDFQNVLNLTCMFDDPKLRRRIIQEVERKLMGKTDEESEKLTISQIKETVFPFLSTSRVMGLIRNYSNLSGISIAVNLSAETTLSRETVKTIKKAFIEDSTKTLQTVSSIEIGSEIFDLSTDAVNERKVIFKHPALNEEVEFSYEEAEEFMMNEDNGKITIKEAMEKYFPFLDFYSFVRVLEYTFPKEMKEEDLSRDYKLVDEKLVNSALECFKYNHNARKIDEIDAFVISHKSFPKKMVMIMATDEAKKYFKKDDNSNEEFLTEEFLTPSEARVKYFPFLSLNKMEAILFFHNSDLIQPLELYSKTLIEKTKSLFEKTSSLERVNDSSLNIVHPTFVHSISVKEATKYLPNLFRKYKEIEAQKEKKNPDLKVENICMLDARIEYFPFLTMEKFLFAVTHFLKKEETEVELPLQIETKIPKNLMKWISDEIKATLTCTVLNHHDKRNIEVVSSIPKFIDKPIRISEKNARDHLGFVPFITDEY